MKEKLEVKETFNATPSEIYAAWLDSEMHGKMTGGEAVCSHKTGGNFFAWDGYISGENLSLVENRQIIQSWRTSEFDENDEDSLLNVKLNKIEGGTEVIITHSNIPEGQTQYEQGWVDNYFIPMKAYFNK